MTPNYILFRYDDDEEQITQYQRIYLEDIEQIEIGNSCKLYYTIFTAMVYIIVVPNYFGVQ